MKRKNPKTGEYFKFGDLRDDGCIFRGYNKSKKNKNGLYKELWLSPIRFNLAKQKSSERYFQSKKPKRKNPDTNNFFEFGDLNEKGERFIRYEFRKSNGKFCDEIWLNEKDYHIFRVRRIYRSISQRNKNILNFDYNHLLEIFPRDWKCPVFKIKMSWNKGITPVCNTPSVDRIDSRKNYQKGNISWISFKANNLKGDSSLQELIKLKKYMESYEKNKS